MRWPFNAGPQPSDWRPTKLRSFLMRRKQTNRHNLRLLSVNLPQGVILRQEGDGRPAPSTDLSAYQEVRPNDLVMNQLGKPHGAIGVSDYHGIISPAYFVAEISQEAVPRFVHHLLRTRLYISEYERRGKYMPPSQFDISWDQFRDIPVVLPPIAEQRMIADYLDTETARIGALITKKRRLIELFCERGHLLRRRRVLRGLDPVSGGGLMEPWHEINLGVLIQLQRGHDLPSDRRVDGTIPVVSSGGVSGNHDTSIASGPGVVTGRYGTVGEVFFISGPYWPLNTTLYVSDFRGNDPKWVYHLLASLPLDLDSQKSAVGGINRNIIGSLRVPRPSLTEQRAIAADLDEAEYTSQQVRNKLANQIELLQERRRALITLVVTGDSPVPRTYA